MALGDLWRNQKYPNGCRNCGQTAKKHIGFGLCQNCYRDPKILMAAKTNELADLLDVDDRPIDSEVDSDTARSDDDTDRDYEVESSGQSERRPGSFTSPVSDSESDVQTGEPSPLDRLFKRKTKTPKPGIKTAEKPPKGVGRRVSTAASIEDAWSAIGGVAVRTGRHAPLGRYLQFQAPAAGEMLDQALSGTAFDRKILQPGVKARGRLDVVSSVIAPPLLIMAIERDPSKAEMLLPMLKASIRSSLPTMLPAMKKAAARETKINEAVKDFFPDMPEGVDPVDLVISEMFAGYFQPFDPNMGEPTTEDTNATIY
jgi:hypothetical protein